MAVSYTDLDMYKRQVYEEPKTGENASLISKEVYDVIRRNAALLAVSYTHLDVYKRQIMILYSASNDFSDNLPIIARASLMGIIPCWFWVCLLYTSRWV